MTQSRWITEFQQHPFQSTWTQIKKDVEELKVDDETVQTAVQEVSRLKRVVSYLDSMLKNIDPELTPKVVWSNFQGQADPCLQQVRAFVSNKNINHIRQANDHADNLLTYLRPYEVLPKEALDALSGATQTYVQDLSRYVNEFREKSTETLQLLKEDKAIASQGRDAIEKHKKKVDSYFAELFEGNSDEKAVELQINELLNSSKEKTETIEEFYTALVVGSPQAISVQAKIKAAETDVQGTREKMNTLLDGAQAEIRSLDTFYEKIFGKKDESGKSIGGLESELDVRLKQLEKLELDQSIKHAALVNQIESLLPGATSAGLASSYKNLKDSFTDPIKRYTLLFYASLGTLVLAAIVMAVQEFSLWPFSIKLVEVKEWDIILRAMVSKAPFIAPVIWLALFSSTRRSQYERLQQEYAHKEALASSYESFKKQLETLNIEGDGLQRDLIAKAIDAIAYNASATLDGKHDEKLPVQHILEKFSIEELKKLSEFIKTLKPT